MGNHTHSINGLPMTRLASWQTYAKIIAGANESGDESLVIQAERWLGLNDLFYLMTRLLRRDDIDNDWIFARCREVERDPNGYLDLWAREHYKSSLITFGLTVQDILRDPEITVAIFSHTRPNAKMFLNQIKREFEQNELLKYIFSDILYTDPARDSPKWNEECIIVRRTGNPKEGTVEAWGLVDGQPTGRHFRLRVYDDVVTRESVATPDQIAKTTQAWELSDFLGTQDGAARYIGTRYHLGDTYATMLQREAAVPRIYPATNNGRMDGKPVLLTDAQWANQLRIKSRTTIAAQMLQNPLADEDATFRVQWLKHYELRPRTLNVYIMCDPSLGRSSDSDNTAIAVVGISAQGTKFLLDGLAHRMTLSQRWNALRNLYSKWSRAPGVQHISVGYERYGMQTDTEYFQEQMLRDKKFFAIEELSWTRDGGQSKRDRVGRLEPDFRNGRFFLPLPVMHNSRPSVWRVDDEPESKTYNNVIYSEVTGLTKSQLEAVNAESAYLVAKVIKAVDQDQHTYDVTMHFIEEYLSFPFGTKKDLVDATSRIYDMQPVVPTVLKPELVNPPEFWDR